MIQSINPCTEHMHLPTPNPSGVQKSEDLQCCGATGQPGPGCDSMQGQNAHMAGANLRGSHTMLRFDSASSEYDLTQQAAGSSAWHALQFAQHSDALCMQRAHSSGADQTEQQQQGDHLHSDRSSTSAAEALPAHLLLADRWDSAGLEVYDSAVLGTSADSVLSDIVAGLSRRLAGGDPALASDADVVIAAAALAGSRMRKAGSGAEEGLDGRGIIARPCAAAHDLRTNERARAPRRRKQQAGACSRSGPPRAKRCLAAAFAAAADAERLAPLDVAPTHSARSPPHQATAPAAALSGNPASRPEDRSPCSMPAGGFDQGHLAIPQHSPADCSEECWRPCELAEVLATAPAGLPDEASRAIVAAVAYALERLHADGLVHRNVSANTVFLGERSCFDTARWVHYPPTL